MTTSAILWSSGDLLAQKLEAAYAPESPNDEPKKFNKVRFAATVAEQSLVSGGVGYFWYSYLDHFASVKLGLKAGSLRFIGAKLALELLVWHPFTLLCFWCFVGAAEGQSVKQIKADLKRDFLPTASTEFLLWTPIDVINFWLVPVHLQVLLINFGGFLEAIGLSYIHANGFPSLSFECSRPSAEVNRPVPALH